ncbi:MAG: ABC transporter ATP-binding protein [Lachnospiraceae bacterium]|jgi:ABC-2 type transport system ATP-binding protein|nr:ABC transporter ATP-binding protein [Lachnospiraceae bacterium]
MSTIQIVNLTKNFGKFTALNGVNMTVKQGEVHAFLGPNGAGKTTTIRCLLGILKADSGTVKLFGGDAWRDAVELHKRLAYVPGDVNLWDNLTGGEVIDLFLSLRGIAVDRSRRSDFLDRFELDPSKKCRTYSKGNRQKVALVAALSANAELYILDEPTSGLDPLLEKVFQDCIIELKKQGKSVLLSSHIMSEVEKLADSVSIIKDGRIVLAGAMNEVLGKGTTLEELFLSEYAGR